MNLELLSCDLQVIVSNLYFHSREMELNDANKKNSDKLIWL
jgi:hypothetical protein